MVILNVGDGAENLDWWFLILFGVDFFEGTSSIKTNKILKSHR